MTRVTGSIKARTNLKEIKDLRDDVTRSDLQGIVMAKAMELDKDKHTDIEEVILQYCDDVLTLDQARYKIVKIIR